MSEYLKVYFAVPLEPFYDYLMPGPHVLICEPSLYPGKMEKKRGITWTFLEIPRVI